MRAIPNGEYDDWVDTVTQTMIRLRKTNHLEFEAEREAPPPSKRIEPIYG